MNSGTKIQKTENKTAIYCRISTSMQSTDRQREDLLKVAKRFERVIDADHIYIDIISGFSIGEDRPRYSALLNEIEKGNIDTILFSELTRLGRNSTELLSEIQRLQAKGIDLYFEKQDLWVRHDKKDLGSRILLAVLAITTAYEIELFAERSISGKIEKVRKGGGVGGDNNAYGYMNDENKIMVIREEEAKVIRRIFTMYADGKSTIEICDILNSEHIPTAYCTRIKEFKERRIQKGLTPKKYKFENEDFSWRPSAIAKLLCKELYKGHREVTFHKPQVDKLENKKGEKKEREVAYKLDVQLEDLRIIPDELFQKVQDRLAKAAYNKNNAIKHDNLLKPKLICGECGSNFSVGKQSDTATQYESDARTYKCYGRVNRKDKPQICKAGAELRQWKLDGLVITLSLQMFAEINIAETNEKRINTLSKEIADATIIRNDKQQQLDNLTNDYKQQIKRLSKMKGTNDIIVSELMSEAAIEYEKISSELIFSLKKLNQDITNKNITIGRLKELSQHYMNTLEIMNEIRQNKELVKAMIDEYVERIIIYKIHPMWNLVIIQYNNNVEMWGTIKSARYKKEEMFYDPLLCRYGVEFKTWALNNSEHCFKYNSQEHTISFNGKSTIYTNIPIGTYNYEEFHNILTDKEWIGSYPFFKYESQDNNKIIITKETII